VNIEYLKEKDNVIADALSRVAPQPTPKGADEEEFIPAYCHLQSRVQSITSN